MKTSMDHTRQAGQPTGSPALASTLAQVHDDAPLSLTEAIEWLGIFGLRATPQRMRQATERYQWVEPVQARPGARKRYSRAELKTLVWVLGLREVGFSTRHIKELVDSLKEVTRCTELKRQGKLRESDHTRWETATVQVQQRVAEALRLAQQKAAVVQVVQESCRGIENLLAR